LDILAVAETWVRESEPDTIKLDLAPPGYAVLLVHQGRLKPAPLMNRSTEEKDQNHIERLPRSFSC